MRLNFKDVDIEDLVINNQNLLFEENEDEKYHKSYFCFIKYFEDKDFLDEQDLIIGANFSYGWMPTILNFKSEKFGECVSIMNQAKTNEIISKEQLSILKGLINNSVVGASKLLHFINPSLYPIWDSRVYQSLFGQKNNARVNRESSYWEYFELCHQAIRKLPIDRITEKFSKHIGYEVTAVRTIEQVLFYYSRFMEEGEELMFKSFAHKSDINKLIDKFQKTGSSDDLNQLMNEYDELIQRSKEVYSISDKQIREIFEREARAFEQFSVPNFTSKVAWHVRRLGSQQKATIEDEATQ